MDKIDPELLRKYAQGTCTEREREAVEAWIHTGKPEDLSVFDDFRDSRLKEEIWTHIVHSKKRRVQKGLHGISKRTLLLGTAASIALMLVVVTLFLKRRTESQVKHIPYKVVEVPYGKKKILRMSDGTLVHLNAGSILRYPVHFDQKQRHVFLQGEGFFAIAKDKNRPFLISTARSFTKVLGTEFNLRDYTADQSPSIILSAGSVVYSGKDGKDPLLLKAMEGAYWTGKEWKKRAVADTHFADWKENVIHLENLTLAEAVPVLERWYNIKIDFDPQFASLQLNGSFRNPSLSKLLKDICYITNIQYTLKNQHVSLHN